MRNENLPRTASDFDEIFDTLFNLMDFLFDVVDFLNGIIETLRNWGDYLSGQ